MMRGLDWETQKITKSYQTPEVPNCKKSINVMNHAQLTPVEWKNWTHEAAA